MAGFVPTTVFIRQIVKLPAWNLSTVMRGTRFLDLLSRSAFTMSPSVASGNYLRLEEPQITATGLEYQNKILQFSAFTSVNWDRTMNVIDFALASRMQELSRH